ncbi:MAG: glycosyltransferase [Acidobacteriaceae bacterium]|nr:glycosyltransferase [Acidobacteriaceae bacterium]
MNMSDIPTAVPPNGLDVIIRIHDPGRGFELRRAIFSLVCQSYRPIKIHLVTQRFPTAEIDALRKAVNNILAIDPSVCLEMYNYTAPEPEDARAALLNIGLTHGTGRYLAFLDHDDTIYAHAYARLVEELNITESAIAFARIAVKEVEVLQDAFLVQKRTYRLIGQTLIDMFHENFCPIHSFIIDRTKVDSRDLWFDERLSKLEDHDFLLRICSKYKSSFGLIDEPAGDYYLKTDGSNTATVPALESTEPSPKWAAARTFIENRRRELVLSPAVQRSLGVYPPDPKLTIRKLLDTIEA